MRPRSCTLYAKQSPYKKPNSSPSTPTSAAITTPKSTTPTSKKYTSEYVSSIFECFGPISVCKVKDAFSGDYGTPCIQSQDNLSNASTSVDDGNRSRVLSRISCDDLLDDIEPEPKASKLFRGMVIGVRNSGKYALVDTLYPTKENVVAYKNVNFDLVTRTIETEDLVERYHFWLKEAGKDERKYRALLDVYYKTCSMFCLVYNRDDKESFEALEHEIHMIKEAIGDKKVLLVLVANKGAGKKRQVSNADVQQLRDKFKIKVFLEGENVKERKNELKERILSLAK